MSIILTKYKEYYDSLSRNKGDGRAVDVFQFPDREGWDGGW